MAVTVRPAHDAGEIEAAKDLRVRVFCDEQGVDRDEELDELDTEAIHVVALDDGSVVATCRLRPLGRDCKLERMAVEADRRGTGVGRELLEKAEGEARRAGSSRMVVHAQRRAEGFYAQAGYASEGETFLEARIEHVRMTKPLDLRAGAVGAPEVRERR